MQLTHALLMCAVSLDFDFRLSYNSHEPPTIYDRTVSKGMSAHGEGYVCWPQEAVISEFFRAFSTPIKDRRILLSLELFASAALESNDHAKFVMAVSALEPLAEQIDLGPEVSGAIDSLCRLLDQQELVPEHLGQSLRGRLLQLKRESVRQALKRLCGQWFPDEPQAWSALDRAYGLRSELLHEGRPNDLDILLHQEVRSVAYYLRRIYQHEYGHAFQAKPIV